MSTETHSNPSGSGIAVSVLYFYKMFLYTDPQGSVDFDTSLKLDFDGKDTIQPTPITFSNTTTTAPFQLPLLHKHCHTI